MTHDPVACSAVIHRAAKEAGFDLVGIADAVTPGGFDHLNEWLRRGFAGEMNWIERRKDAYQDPGRVLERVRSIVMVGLNYSTSAPVSPEPGQGRVSRYAWNDTDYHTVVRERLKPVAGALHQLVSGVRTRVVVDTAPLLERDFARLAGLGWFGKNTLLLNQTAGSWFFLGALLTDCELAPDRPELEDHCGNCTLCLEACPTDAFAEPRVLDARKCISYLTIELRDQDIPAALRPGIGDWVFGCDVCQDVCPWNHKAPQGAADFRPEPDRNPVDLVDLLRMTEDEFDRRFGATPLHRTGRDSLARNAAIALGNQRHRPAEPALRAALDHSSAVVREAARWALQQLAAQDD